MFDIGALATQVARYRVAPNLLMLAFALAGGWALTRMHTSFFPAFETDKIGVAVTHRGLDPQEIEDTILQPLENRLRSLAGLEEMTAYAREGSASIWLEFPEGTDMERALTDVKAAVDEVALPAGADVPRSTIRAREEEVAKFTVAADNRGELRDLARRLEADFNAQGIAKLKAVGLPEEEIIAWVDQRLLLERGMTLADVGRALRAQNVDAAIGVVSGLGNERSLRAESATDDLERLYALPIGTADGATFFLRDIARLERRSASDQVELVHNGRPAVRFEIIKHSGGDLIGTAKQAHAWVEKLRPTLPANIDLQLHDERWRSVDARLKLLVKNGLGGMLIVVALLYLFLSRQVAFWVAIGIPVAMLGTLFVFERVGGTFNMISMFALIMAVGIIVDDSIVVGEDAQRRLDQGAPPMRAVTGAATTMFTPVFASSFTTIASFMPLFLVGGTIGKIIFDIPMVIVCILIAALLECFLVLPGHLYASFAARRPAPPGRLRAALDRGFVNFRERGFRPAASFAVRHPGATIAACLTLLVLSVMLLVNGFVKYRFFPGAEVSEIRGILEFSSGTPRSTMEAYVNRAVDELYATERELSPDEPLLLNVTALYGYGDGGGDHRARIDVELTPLDERSVSTQRFTRQWQQALGPLPPGLEKMSLRGGRHGHGGQDIELLIGGADISALKQAALELQEALRALPELSSVTDDTPYGADQLLFELTPLGRSLNLNVDMLASQIRAAVDGFTVQTLTSDADETDLKVRYAGSGLDGLYIRLPGGDFAPLHDLASWEQRSDFAAIIHREGLPAITVSGDLDENAAVSVEDILAGLEASTLPALRRTYGVTIGIEGQRSGHQRAVGDMQVGLMVTLLLVFVILVAVFNSWSLPIVVMLSMPLGVAGAIAGHGLMGMTMSILSFFGIFTLMGITVNNAIVLVRCFQDLSPRLADRAAYEAAIIEAACRRLRAVMLTTLTTVGGLTPLLFETSRQAQFLIPMAASIVFGLAFSALVILFYTPACLALHGAASRLLSRLTRSGPGLRRLQAARH